MMSYFSFNSKCLLNPFCGISALVKPCSLKVKECCAGLVWDSRDTPLNCAGEGQGLSSLYITLYITATWPGDLHVS